LNFLWLPVKTSSEHG
jgi:hypothetical protein